MLNPLRSKQTDDEFVESIRRQMPASRKLLIGMIALYGAMLVALLVYIPRYVHSFRQLAPDASAYEWGFKLRLFIGATAGGAAIGLIWHFVHSLMMLFGPSVFRVHRLLVKYHDLASNRSPEASLK